jgi:hypothetical protein
MTQPEIATYDVEHGKITSITFTSVPADGGIEFYVELKDGAVYSFTAYTPAQLDQLMTRNGWLSFVDEDTIIIKEGSLEAVMHAMEQVLLMGIEHFGIRVQEATGEANQVEDPWTGL